MVFIIVIVLEDFDSGLRSVITTVSQTDSLRASVGKGKQKLLLRHELTPANLNHQARHVSNENYVIGDWQDKCV